MTPPGEPGAAAYARPRPTITAANAPFWDALRQHRLVLPRCGRCGATSLPPGPVCPFCLSLQIDWYDAEGVGRVTSWVVYNRIYHPALAEAIPYAVVEVELAEGPRLTSSLVGVANQAITAGLEVEVVYDDVASDLTLHRFRPRGEFRPRVPA